MIARAAELLHAGLDLEDRVSRLLLRLDLGILGPAVDLARFTQRALDRSDYRRLCETVLTTREALIAAEDATLLPLLGNDRQKLRDVRDALAKWRPDRAAAPALPVYQQ
jgi:hypothetical protein